MEESSTESSSSDNEEDRRFAVNTIMNIRKKAKEAEQMKRGLEFKKKKKQKN